MVLLSTVQRCADFVTKYGKNGWERMCQNIAFASSVEYEFLELSNALLHLSSELQFFILVEQTVREEDSRANDADIVEVLNTIVKELQNSGQSNAAILALLYAQLDILKQDKQLMSSIVPALQTFLDRSNSILSLAELPSLPQASLPLTLPPTPNLLPIIVRTPSTKESMKLILRFSEIDVSLLDPIKTVIGRGQHGVVYSCRYNHRVMALKEFQSIGQLSSEVLLKIKREAAIMSLLRNKNIVSFEGFSLSSGFIVMELAHCSLFSLLHNSDKVSVPPLLEAPSFLHHLMICEDILNGLRYLHFHNIQHRDIKSANILLFIDSSRSNNIVAKISDFGIAFMVGSTCTSSTYTSNIGGTLAYMAPELLCIEDDNEDDDNEGDSSPTKGNESSFRFSFSSDIYALGVLFNEILTGKVPWSNLAHNSLIQPRVAKGKRPILFKPSSPSSDTTGVEKQLVDLIGNSSTGCLSQDPMQRPSAATLHEGISALLQVQQHNYDVYSKASSVEGGKSPGAPPLASLEVPTTPSSSSEENPVGDTTIIITSSNHPVRESFAIESSIVEKKQSIGFDKESSSTDFRRQQDPAGQSATDSLNRDESNLVEDKNQQHDDGSTVKLQAVVLSKDDSFEAFTEVENISADQSSIMAAMTLISSDTGPGRADQDDDEDSDSEEIQTEWLEIAKQAQFAIQNFPNLRSKTRIWFRTLIIEKSLTILDSEDNRLAMVVYKKLWHFIKESEFPTQSAQDILYEGYDNNDSIRDEIYLLIINQLADGDHHTDVVVARLWILMCMCVGVFRPSKTFQNYLLHYLMQKRDKSIGDDTAIYANYCIHKLRVMIERGQEERAVPSVEKLAAYNDRPPIVATIHLVDDTIITKELPISPDLNVDIVLAACLESLNMKDPRASTALGIFAYDLGQHGDNDQFSEVSDLKRTPRPLRSKEYLGDVIASKKRQHRNFKFVLKRKIFSPQQNYRGDDLTFEKLMYLQAVDDVINTGDLEIPTVGDAAHLAAIVVVMKGILLTVESLIEHSVLSYIPPSWRLSSRMSEREWAQLVIPFGQIPGYGRHWIYARKLEPSSYYTAPLEIKMLPEDLILGFDYTETLIYDINRKHLMSIAYADVIRWSGKGNHFTFVLARSGSEFDFTIMTSQVRDIASIIYDSIHHSNATTSKA
eukprot:gene26245-34867_t